jgi:hypothetical protein
VSQGTGRALSAIALHTLAKPMGTKMRTIAKRYGHLTIAASERSIPQLSGFSALLGVSFIVILSFIASSLVYKFVEKPWRERSREFAFSRLA